MTQPLFIKLIKVFNESGMYPPSGPDIEQEKTLNANAIEDMDNVDSTDPYNETPAAAKTVVTMVSGTKHTVKETQEEIEQKAVEAAAALRIKVDKATAILKNANHGFG